MSHPENDVCTCRHIRETHEAWMGPCMAARQPCYCQSFTDHKAAS